MEKSNILVLLEQQHDNFPAIAEFFKKKGLDSATIFLPQSLRVISEEISYRSDLLAQCLSYLDIVKIYSLIIYDDPEFFTTRLESLIVANRTVSNSKLVVNYDAVDDFLFTSEEDLRSFLQSNKFLLALYIFSIVNQLFFKQF